MREGCKKTKRWQQVEAHERHYVFQEASETGNLTQREDTRTEHKKQKTSEFPWLKIVNLIWKLKSTFGVIYWVLDFYWIIHLSTFEEPDTEFSLVSLYISTL